MIKPDYRKLLLDKDIEPSLLYFTVGNGNGFPLRFNPFAVADKTLVKTHISRLLQVFTTAYQIADPIPIIYREALRELYKRAGWDLEKGTGENSDAKGNRRKAPTLGSYYSVMVDVLDRLTKGYSNNVRGDISQASEIRMRDLLQNSGSTLNVTSGVNWGEILSKPTVLELAWLGSEEDIALVMGMLLTSLTGELSSRKLAGTSPSLHISLIEEAHRLMPEAQSSSGNVRAELSNQSSKLFDRIMAEVRGLNEGIIIAEQTPNLLTNGALANTNFKIMHRVEDISSFNMLAQMFSLNEQQQKRTRNLQQGRAIILDDNGNPLHIHVDKYEGQRILRFESYDDTESISDTMIKKHMNKQPYRLEEYGRLGSVCHNCRVPCLYGDKFKKNKFTRKYESKIHAIIKKIGLAIDNEKPTNPSLIKEYIKQDLAQELLEFKQPNFESDDVGYCALAHIVKMNDWSGTETMLEIEKALSLSLSVFHSTG